MIIRCPYCGAREASEFSYLGSATARRPDPSLPDAPGRFVDAVHFRENACGPNEELWFHASGCRQWLEVTRDTRTHKISDVRFCAEKR